MDGQYKQEVKYGQNGLQRLVSVIAFWQTVWQQWHFSACWKLFPTLINSSKSTFRNMETKERHVFRLHYLFSAICDELILSVTWYRKTCLYITNSWLNTRYAMCWWAQGCTNPGSKSLWRI